MRSKDAQKQLARTSLRGAVNIILLIQVQASDVTHHFIVTALFTHQVALANDRHLTILAGYKIQMQT